MVVYAEIFCCGSILAVAAIFCLFCHEYLADYGENEPPNSYTLPLYNSSAAGVLMEGKNVPSDFKGKAAAPRQQLQNCSLMMIPRS